MSDQDPSLDAAPQERDETTSDMFGGAPQTEPVLAPVASGAAYQVLARKYRPRTFEDLIGQEAMVRTLANAFATGRIAHAFMLTGVRGVGKTTTARLLARALNYDSDTQHGPSVDLSVEGRHCRAIIEGRHMDVLEMDAASRTGVGDMREILDSVRYAPVEARYKVYVIDEVHMLSTGAFNALLKTLEEPPPHAKFIFATTEIRKVPVTILSRCQRFDLRRVEPDQLGPHLTRICDLEGVRVEQEGISLIARAAEGSVRDGLSLLDQALVQSDHGATVSAELIRDMLGLADRTATIALFEAMMGGRVKDALDSFRSLYGYGVDPAQLVSDLLEHCHGTTLAKTLGPDATRLPSEQASRLAALGAAMSAGNLSRVWQMLLKALDEVRRAPDPAAAMDMAIIRICYASDLPGPEEVLKRLQSGQPITVGPSGGGTSGGGSGGGGSSGGGATARAAQPASLNALPDPQSFDQVIALVSDKREIGLRMDIERYVKLVSFKPGAIVYEPAPGAPIDLQRKLAQRLFAWTGKRWLVAADGGGGGETLYDRDKREAEETRANVLKDPFVAQIFDTFPGAKLVSVRSLKAPDPMTGALGHGSLEAPTDPDEAED